MPSSRIYVGIDVACAVDKRLPICIVSGVDPVTPMTILKHLSAAIPRGVGNKEIISTSPFREAARVMDEMGWRVERIAIDAPAAPHFAAPCASESELGHLGLLSF